MAEIGKRRAGSGWSCGLGWLFLGLALVSLMPSNQSFWIDEALAIPYAREQTVTGVLERLGNEQGSEALMPLAMFSAWAGARVFGQSELGFRVVNSLWAAFAIFLMWRIGVTVGAPWLSMVFACHPFLWCYAGEARPYAMVIAMGTGLLFSLVAVQYSEDSSPRGMRALLVFGPLLCATTVLGVAPFAVTAVIVVVVLRWRKWRPRGKDWAGIVASIGMLSVLGVYYLWVLGRGGADRDHLNHGLLHLKARCFRDMSSLASRVLDPGVTSFVLRRSLTALRAHFATLIRPSVVGSVFLVLIYLIVVYRFSVRLRSRDSDSTRAAVLAAVVIAATWGAALVVSFAAGAGFWGRYLAALLPFVMFVSVLAAKPLAINERRSPGVLTMLLAAALLCSSLFVRFDPSHRRDDYRSAARFSVDAAKAGKTVWWAASDGCARYYGISFCRDGVVDQTDCVVFATNKSVSELIRETPPDLVVLSKPDLHDRNHGVRLFLESNQFREVQQVMAFRVYQPR